MTDTTQPDALQIADEIAPVRFAVMYELRSLAANELRRLHAECESLRTQLAEARADAKALRSLVTRAIGGWTTANADIAPTPAAILMDGLREIDAAIAAKGE